tara:strand:+ start:239 stop:403 length:165 start_codon:yes stop_codon:yes gene_type:complete
MDIVAFIVVGGLGITLGMYIATQIGESIERKTSNKKFLKDMEEFDTKRKVNGTR